ncbi:hypothetical protein [Streptococcus sp. DD04]|uniref:hypothetical protein n=1 Tax=Streptococcus sp. DD04 TaxID=1776578 RepID=UPI0007808122|nr:hypothetical protein [Streptococcus sp. DD04]KXT67484.1 hypothetical protein STRDD04_00091 [Streptococcus sp. DD04]
MTDFPIKEAIKYFVALPENISCVFMDNHSPDNGTAIEITLKLSEQTADVFFGWVFPKAFLRVA